jgi:hypothetical protein
LLLIGDKKKEYKISYYMNGSYLMEEEIDCSCFNFQDRLRWIVKDHSNKQEQVDYNEVIKVKNFNASHCCRD